jgi:hypothetical protein
MNTRAGYTRFTNRDTSITGLGKGNLAEVEMKKMSLYQSSDLQSALEIKLPKFFLKVVILWLLLIITGESALAQTELITNGGFETVGSGWVVLTNGMNQTDSWWNINNPSGAHSGSRYEYIGAQQDGVSSANNVDGLIYQTVAIPAGTTSATLSYYLRITTSESSSAAFDHLYVEIRNTSGTVLATPLSYSNQSASQFSSWTQQTVNLSSYAGQTIRVAFQGVTDSGTITVFRIDDVSLQATGTTVPAAPTLNSPGSTSSPGPVITILTPLMSWNAVNGATNYGLYVYDVTTSMLIYNNDFVGNITSLTLPSLTAGHSYRWNMRASNSAGFGGYSGLLYFQTQATTPTAPTPSSPSGGQVITTFTPQLTWSGGSNFSSLQINISKSPFGAANIIYTSSWLSASTTSITPTPALVAGTNYRWDVTACSGANGTGTCVTGSNATFSTQATPILSVTPINPSVATTAGSINFSVSNTGGGTLSYSASVTSGSSWLSITSGASGGNSGTISVSFAANSGAQRTGTIMITASGASGSPVTLTITQAAPGGTNTSPLSGKGDWITNTYSAIANNLNTVIHCRADDPAPHTPQNQIQDLVQQLIDFEKSKGIQYLIVKAGEGNHLYPASPDCPKVDATFVQIVHNASLKLFGYHYVYGGALDALGPGGMPPNPLNCDIPKTYEHENFWCDDTDPKTEGNQAIAILGTGVDGLVIDAEDQYMYGSPYRIRKDGTTPLPAADAAKIYFNTIRASYPNAFLAHAPYPLPTSTDKTDPLYDTPFPYMTFGENTQAVLPQAYYRFNGLAPVDMADKMNSAWITVQDSWVQNGHPDAVKPIFPVGYGDGYCGQVTVTRSDILDFVGELNRVTPPASAGGYSGVSFYDAECHTADIWDGISEATIGSGSNSDTTPPTISGFNVGPSTVALGQGFTISYTVSDSGGSHLKQVELWRASIDGTINDSSWTRIGNPIPLSGDGPSNGSFPIDIPSALGNYWYGMHVLDNANPANYMDERIAGLAPVHVTVTPPSDTVPDAFSFTSQTGVALNTTVTSNTITVSGINAAAATSVTGGSYSVNGGGFTAGSGTVNNGNTVAVRLTSSGSYSTQTCATLNIGGVQGAFCATTQPPPVDTTPDAFSFTPQTGVALNTAVTSNTITVSGINAAAATSVTGGSYSVNGGGFTAGSGTVNNGNTVAVRLTSSGSYSTQTCATLNIGGVQGSFCATTQPAPVDTIVFVELAGICNGNTPCFSSIQQAIDAVALGGTVKVAQGTYHENVFINTSATFILEGGWNTSFTIRSLNPALTVIDGDITGEGVGDGRVFEITAVSGVDITLKIDGFTIQNGTGNDGGGVFGWASSGGSLDLNLTSNIIKNNQATNSGAGVGVYAQGTGTTAHATLTNNMIFGNESGGNGGGVYAYADLSGELTMTLTNNTITDNTAVGVGGGLRAYASHGSVNDVTVKNSILWGNTAASGQDIAVRQSVAGIATVNSSFNDVGDALPDATGPGTYNNLGNNINTDPLFVNLIGGDLRLGAGSPAIDTGTSTDAPVTDFEGQARPQGAGYDMGADESIAVPPLSVLTPKSGDIWRIGTNQTINWMPSGVTGNVQIQISRNGGSWKAIINNTANDGSQAWKVAKPATLRAKVRVCRISAPLICGPSSPTFIIQ